MRLNVEQGQLGPDKRIQLQPKEERARGILFTKLFYGVCTFLYQYHLHIIYFFGVF